MGGGVLAEIAAVALVDRGGTPTIGMANVEETAVARIAALAGGSALRQVASIGGRPPSIAARRHNREIGLELRAVVPARTASLLPIPAATLAARAKTPVMLAAHAIIGQGHVGA